MIHAHVIQVVIASVTVLPWLHMLMNVLNMDTRLAGVLPIYVPSCVKSTTTTKTCVFGLINHVAIHVRISVAGK